METPLLEVTGLTAAYSRGLGSRANLVAVKGISFDLAQGETLGIIGESGSGKSTVLSVIVGLLRPLRGEIRFHGENIARKKRSPAFRREVSMLFQSVALNPKLTVLDIVAEPLRNHEKVSAQDARRRVSELLELAELTPDLLSRYPSELSGGQRQRVGLARALALKPSLLLADEPVTALDATVRAQVLDTLRGLCNELKMACIFVTHDLGVAKNMCGRFCIMQQGKIVENGDRARIFENPQHPYTKRLIAAAPSLHPDTLAERMDP